MGRYKQSEIKAFVREVLGQGFCVLPGHFAREKMEAWRAAFAPLLERHVEREGHRLNRGPGRYYVTLPFTAPFADPEVYEDDDVLGVVRGLVGEDATLVQLATDTPLLGSEYQDVHRDAPPLFPEWGRETPPFQLAVNFALVDVTPENGPFEIARATHVLSKVEGLRRIAEGGARLEPLLLRAGDVMI